MSLSDSKLIRGLLCPECLKEPKRYSRRKFKNQRALSAHIGTVHNNFGGLNY